MTADRWARVKALTADALELPKTERVPFLARACGGDATLLAEVSSLLGAHDQAGGFLGTPVLADTSAAEAVARATHEATSPMPTGRRVGPYRVLREIGRGGMGVVYLAARDDAAFEKQVAIKVVPLGLAGEGLMRRFREERRILATLDHPHIARLLDGGTTDDGLPYLVMEYVDGIPLDVYAQSNALAVRDRLALFGMVCAAVQYAHQRLVIHRDLKAGNILVTRDGRPKLLDFGIAKLLEPGVEADDQTRTGMRALTLDAASPEQVRGEPLTVTSDVYALGVLLYRLLAGQGPYGASRRTDPEMVRAICEETPVRPSGLAPPADARDLRGELDWITLKALRKEPDRRYASVQHLADDIQRHLSGRPVAAAPDSWGYRARKFAVRNRTLVAATVVLALSMAAGLTATLWQARRADAQRARAERRFADVRKLASSFLFEFHDAIKDLPGSTAARRLVAAKALEYLDSLAGEQSADPELSLELAIAYQRVAVILGAPFEANLGDTPGAIRSVQRAIDIEEALARADPGRRTYEENLAQAYRLLSTLRTVTNDDKGSLEAARRALEVMERLAAAHPEDAQVRKELPRFYDQMGDLTSNMGDLEEGLRQYRKAGAVIETILAAAPNDERALRSLIANRDSVAIILGNPRYPNLDDAKGALAVIEEAVKVSEARAKTDRSVAFKTWLGHSLISMGEIQSALGDWAGAMASQRKAVAWWETLVEADRNDVSRKLYLAFALTELGEALSETGRAGEARAALGRAMDIAAALGRADPASAEPLTYLAFAEAVNGGILARHGDPAGALRSYEDSIDRYRGLVAKNGINLQLRLELAAPCLGSGRVGVAQARRASSRESAALCARALGHLQCGVDNYAEMRRHFALTRKQSRELAEAEAAIGWCRGSRP